MTYEEAAKPWVVVYDGVQTMQASISRNSLRGVATDGANTFSCGNVSYGKD